MPFEKLLEGTLSPIELPILTGNKKQNFGDTVEASKFKLRDEAEHKTETLKDQSVCLEGGAPQPAAEDMMKNYGIEILMLNGRR